MKKLAKISAALASLALLATGLIGCVDGHSDLDPLVDLSTATICGSINGWKNGEVLTANDDGSYYYDFEAKGTQENFALRGSDGWGVDYRSEDGANLLSEYVLDKEMELVPFNSVDCPPLKDLTPGDNYRITVKPSGASVFMTITHTGSNSAAFYVLDTTKGAVKFDYDGEKYTYVFKATSAAANILIWSSDNYYYVGDGVSEFKKDTKLETSEQPETTKFSGLETDGNYKITLTTDDKKTYSISIAENLIDISSGDIIGDLDGDGIPFSTATYNETANSWTIELAYKNSMSAWGGSNGKCHFKIRKTAGAWSGDYGYSDFEVGTLPTGVTYIEDDGNPTLSGLSEKTYELTFTGKFSKIKIDVTEK